MQIDVEDDIVKCNTGRRESKIRDSRLPFSGITAWLTLCAKVSKERLSSDATN
jgi:hypothetical protein